MPSVVSDTILKELQSECENNPYTFISNFEGVTVEDISELRRNLEKVAKRSLVVKHSLAKKAFKSIDVEAADNFFKGHLLLTIGEKDPQNISKTLVDYAKDNDKFDMAGVVFERQLHDATYVKTLAKLPSRQELLTQVVVRVQSPISGFVMTLNQMLKGLAVALNEIKKQKEAAA